MPSKISQRQRSHHENDRHAGRDFSKQIACAAAAEDRRAGTAEYSAHFSAFAGLQQLDQYESDADDDMNDCNNDDHQPINP